jgi:hypothetical protein
MKFLGDTTPGMFFRHIFIFANGILLCANWPEAWTLYKFEPHLWKLFVAVTVAVAFSLMEWNIRLQRPPEEKSC